MTRVAIGDSLGSYRLLERLGEGGMGVVFLAEHEVLRRRAAIKVLQPALAGERELLERFFREARATAAIHHPGIVDIYDFGHHPSGAPFIVMEYLAGESVARRVRRGVLAIPLALAFMRQVCGAVAAVHALGIVHRDLKPDNLFLVPDADLPGGQRVKVLDFGIAKLHNQLLHSSPGPQTQVGVAIGTCLYMAPEQCRGVADIDHRCDIYSAGCILYEIITGRPPFLGESPLQVMDAHIHESPRPPSSFSPTVPAALDDLILWTLAKRRTDRPGSMADVAQAIDALGIPLEEKRASAPAIRPSQPVGLLPTAPAVELDDEPTIAREPSALATTLGSVASQQVPAPTGRGRRRGLTIGALAAVVIGGVAAVVVATSSSRPSVVASAALPDAAPPDAAPVAIVADAAPASVIDAAPVASDAAPLEVELRITSVPTRAAVLDEGGKQLGTTTLRLRRPSGAGVMKLVIRRAGYKDAPVELPLDRNGVARVVLERKPTPRPDATPKPPPLDLSDEPIR